MNTAKLVHFGMKLALFFLILLAVLMLRIDFGHAHWMEPQDNGDTIAIEHNIVHIMKADKRLDEAVLRQAEAEYTELQALERKIKLETRKACQETMNKCRKDQHGKEFGR